MAANAEGIPVYQFISADSVQFGAVQQTKLNDLHWVNAVSNGDCM